MGHPLCSGACQLGFYHFTHKACSAMHHPNDPRVTPRVSLSRALALVVLGSGAMGCTCKEPSTPTAPPPVVSASALPSASSSLNVPPQAAPPYQTIIDAPDRSPEDRALDGGRHPLDLLQFLDLKPGMKVAEISAGGGYTTELLARAVGSAGVVYGQNSKFILERFAEKPWSERLKKSIMSNVVRVDRDFDDPLPPEAKNLDAVIDVLFYHDTVWMKTDRERMNRAIYAALRPGGAYFIIDHSSRPGAGVSEAQTNHRIEEQVVRDEVLKADDKVTCSLALASITWSAVRM